MSRRLLSAALRPPRALRLARALHTSAPRRIFYEKDKKGGYDTESPERVSNLEHLKLGFGQLKHEIALWRREVREKFEREPLVYYQPGVLDPVFDFRDAATLQKFIVTADRDHNEGRSRGAFETSPAGRALFAGAIDKTPPKDGKTHRTGWCNVRSMRVMRSFQRDGFYDWTMYNTLTITLRGDGRPYMIMLGLEGYYDLTWNDAYSYVLYTRGGPYWQTARIPFSKFLFSAKGRIQDRQSRIPLEKVTHVGITCAQNVSGSFSLELESIGVEFDPEHEEEFAYELYRTEPNLGSQ